MKPYSVHYHLAKPREFTRLQLAVRFVAFLALGVLGLSFGTVFAFAYLALPVYAASRIGRVSPHDYAEHDGPKVLNVLRWFAAISAWAGLVAESLPTRSPDDAVRLEVDADAGTPGHAGRAIARVLTGLPSAIVLALLCWFGMLVWLWAAFTILVRQRIGDHSFDYLVGLQRWSLRLLVYQASLVDEYPPFSLSEAPSQLPPAHAQHAS